jgi:hypothetical protein
MLFRYFLILSSISAAIAACDNSCSGHGTCGEQGICTCYDNWGLGLPHYSGDCSQRICPFDIAWVDTPNKVGRRHKYAECSARGICNRDSGECDCFPGYEGNACQRTDCPNDCSGHGRCKYIEELPFYAVPFDYDQGYFLQQLPETFTYYNWDKSKTRGCYCDPGYGDLDCSKRMCPYGTDVMDQRDDLTSAGKYQVQQIYFETFNDAGLSSISDETFALTFTSRLNESFTTIPIVLDYSDLNDFATDIQSSLEHLPNYVIDKVNVAASISGNGVLVNITFTGDSVQGPQHYLTVRAYECGDGCSPKLTGMTLQPKTQNVTELQLSDYSSYECGRRGKCDYSTGICQCFSGYTGINCNTITSLV